MDRQPAPVETPAAPRVRTQISNILVGLAVAAASAAFVWAIQRPTISPPQKSDVATVATPQTSAVPPAGATPTPSIGSPGQTAPSEATTSPPSITETAVQPVTPDTQATTAPATAVAPAVREDIASANRLRPVRWTTCRGDDTAAALQACGALAADMAIEGATRAEAQRRLGFAQRKSGDLDAALKSLTDSVETSPTAIAYSDRGTAYLLKGEYAKALADYDASIKLDSKNGEAWNNRAWTHYKAGDSRKALDDANQAVKLSGSQAFVWDTRGHIHEAMGARKSAELDFQKALSIDPQLSTAQSALRRLTGR